MTAGAPAADLRVGDYLLGPEIARGAMGAVHRGSDPEGRPVAIKRLLDEELAARFEIEGRLLMRLRHPHVVPTLEAVEIPDGRFLVMEWVDGLDLGQVLEREGAPGLPPERALGYVRDACDALAYVHEQQIVHRDVKPENLVLGAGGRVMLVDFGIARRVVEGGGATSVVGTPAFMPPEAWFGGPFTPRTDVYSVAATLWKLLTGEVVGSRPLKPHPLIPEDVFRVLDAALTLDPDLRTPTMAAFAAGLGAEVDTRAGVGLSAGIDDGAASRALLEAVVRTAASVFDAAAVSLAVTGDDGGLVYQAAWGYGADAIVGKHLPPGEGIAGAAVAERRGIVVDDCRRDPRFAAAVAKGTGYVPHTMMVAPLMRDGLAHGAVTVLDRRDGSFYDVGDLRRAEAFADLALVALDTERI